MGGLSAPNSSDVGSLESQSGTSVEASQYDTHDRMLIFHLNRILHKDHKYVHNDVRDITRGANLVVQLEFLLHIVCPIMLKEVAY